MKISKLFHLLYAFLMALPIFAILSTCLISTFNMSSKQESEIIYKYETNEVNDANDLIVGRIYHVVYETHNANTQILKCDAVYNISCKRNDRPTILNYDVFGNIIISAIENENTLRITDYNGYTIGNISYIDLWEFDVVYNDLLDTNYTTYSKCNIDNIPIENVETNNLDTQDIFYNAIDKVKQSPLFSWAYNSFLSAPLVYIVGLFSIPTNSIFVEMLSYWLAISVIWLVFDLIMYVPLLIHRWLDKGVLE